MPERRCFPQPAVKQGLFVEAVQDSTVVVEARPRLTRTLLTFTGSYAATTSHKIIL
jgi:hypothetical protein